VSLTAQLYSDPDCVKVTIALVVDVLVTEIIPLISVSAANAVLNIHWKYHLIILSPFILYGFASVIAYSISAQMLITGLISGHLYSGITVTFVFYIALKSDNQALRNEQKRLVLDIERYRTELKGLGIESK